MHLLVHKPFETMPEFNQTSAYLNILTQLCQNIGRGSLVIIAHVIVPGSYISTASDKPNRSSYPPETMILPPY